jgi:hypothetical protein
MAESTVCPNVRLHLEKGISELQGLTALQAAIQVAGFAHYRLAVIVANGTANAVHTKLLMSSSREVGLE